MKNLLGLTFGRLTVLEYVGKHGKDRAWKCACSCGVVKTTDSGSLVSGRAISCGCYRVEQLVFRSTTHGKKHSKAYTVWQNMKKRCFDETNKAFQNYGGRGITVCERWLKFQNFYIDMGDPPKNSSLDRIDNCANYAPDNCRWATKQEQIRNRRITRFITHAGKTLCVADWERELGYKKHTVSQRIKRGWSPEKAVSEPLKHKK